MDPEFSREIWKKTDEYCEKHKMIEKNDKFTFRDVKLQDKHFETIRQKKL